MKKENIKKGKIMSLENTIKNRKGITLIALVVTIVVLLILAGITISLVFSENGIIAKAREAADKTKEAVINEQAQMNELAGYMENMLNGIGGSGTTPEPEPEPELPADGSYSEEKGVNTPNLGEGMTAIKWDENANSGAGDWVETEGNDPDWYDYSAKKWANAKTVDGSMWVWIPRYAYSIPSEGYHTSNETEISIEFMKGTSNEGATGQTIVEYNDSTTTNYTQFPSGYVIHPAFNYGSTVSGIWVAKFEASQNGSAIQVKPGVQSWRSITVDSIYTNCLNYDSTTLGNANLNSHMMKNDEWGAVAYLSRSKYGTNKEVTINSNSSYYTGGGSGNTYVNNGAQSTTGNVWGVYDMSGGAWENVAAYVDNGNGNLTSYGKSLVNGDSKTKNVYSQTGTDSNTNNYNTNKGVYGDAVYETSTSGSGTTSWYSDYSDFPNAGIPFFVRGGGYNDGSNAGVFYFGFSNGDGSSYHSFRPVLVAN